MTETRGHRTLIVNFPDKETPSRKLRIDESVTLSYESQLKQFILNEFPNIGTVFDVEYLIVNEGRIVYMINILFIMKLFLIL